MNSTKFTISIATPLNLTGRNLLARSLKDSSSGLDQGSKAMGVARLWSRFEVGSGIHLDVVRILQPKPSGGIPLGIHARSSPLDCLAMASISGVCPVPPVLALSQLHSGVSNRRCEFEFRVGFGKRLPASFHCDFNFLTLVIARCFVS